MRIAVTGVGCVSPLGIGAPALVDAVRAGRCGVAPAPWAPDAPGPSLFAAVHPDVDLLDLGDPRLASGADPFARYAIAAVDEALAQAGLAGDGTPLDPLATAIVDGTSMGGFYSLMAAQHAFEHGGPTAIDPKAMLKVWSNMAAAQLAIRHQLHGPQLTVTTACASSLDAIGQGIALLRAGRAEVALCGGTEGGAPRAERAAGFVPATAVAGRMLGMETPETDPERAVLPFDPRRRGIVFGEGAGWFVLETEDHARRRGAPVLAWILGVGSCADAHHPSSPDPSGTWAAHAIALALADAGVAPADVDVVFAHATGTPKGDRAEAAALELAFAGRPPAVTALKGHTGHTGASSGAMSTVCAIAALRDGRIEPIRGTERLDPDVDLDAVLGEPRALAAEVALIDAFGFGGQDAALVLGRGDATTEPPLRTPR